MKKNRSLSIIIFALVASLLILLIMSNQALSTADTSPQVSVILNDSNSGRWVRFRAGLEQAAKDYNINLNYVTTTKSNDFEQEKAVIDKEIENGTNAMIIQLVNNVDSQQYINEKSKKTMIALVETDLEDPDTNKSYLLARADNQGIGTALGQMVIDGTTDVSGSTVGIVTGNTPSMKERLLALQTALQQRNVRIAWTVQTTDELLMKQNADPATSIVTLDNDSLEEVAAYYKDIQRPSLIYGVGCSDKTIYYLDSGRIDGMIVPNEYTMGYVSLAKVARHLSNRLAKVEDTTVNYFKITKENLYSTENQKLIFPIVG